MYTHDLRVNPATGLLTSCMMPEDVILNTRRAFNTSPAFRDTDNTFDPGGRLGQLVFRLNW